MTRSVSVEVRERLVETPTLRRLKAQHTAVARYVFRLDNVDLKRLAALKVSDSGVIAFALIRAAAFGDRDGDWIIVTHRAVESVSRSHRWWHRATSQLETAGLIECQRHRGRMPRYRLRRKTRKTSA